MEKIAETFLANAAREIRSMAEQSDLFEVSPQGPAPFQTFDLFFHTICFIRGRSGAVAEHEGVWVQVTFPDDYVSRQPKQTFLAPEIVALLTPPNIWHPNIRFPFLCIGQVAPRTSFSDLVFMIYEVLRYSKVAPQDPLNKEAAYWARRNMHLFPVDTRPLLFKEAVSHD